MRASDTIVSPSSFTQKITTTVNYYVSPSGNDTTGIGTTGNPYLTITKVLSLIEDKLITNSGKVNIILKNGTHSYSSSININHPNGDRIAIYSDNFITTTCTGYVSYSGSAGAYSLTITLGSVTGIANGDYLFMPQQIQGHVASAGAGGPFIITGISGNNVTVTATGYTVPTSAFTSNNVYISKANITFTNCNGFIIKDGISLGTQGSLGISNLVILGNTSYIGIFCMDSSVLFTSYIGIGGFECGLYASTSSINASYVSIMAVGYSYPGVNAYLKSMINIQNSNVIVYKSGANSSQGLCSNTGSFLFAYYVNVVSNYTAASSIAFYSVFSSFIYGYGNNICYCAYGYYAERNSNYRGDNLTANYVNGTVYFANGCSFGTAYAYYIYNSGTTASPSLNTVGNSNSYICG